MDLTTFDSALTGRLKMLDGRTFRGIVYTNSVLRTQNDVADYLLSVNAKCFARAGDACYYEGNTVFLLGEGVQDFSGGPLTRSLRMVRANAHLAHSRATAAVDAVSGLAKASGGPTNLGTIWCSMLATSKINDGFHTADSKYALITNDPTVQVADQIGKYICTFVQTLHGLTFFEVK